MTIVGFKMNKLLVEKASDVKGAKVSVKSNIKIKDIQETKLSVLKADQKGIRYDYEFVSDYQPKAGKILIEGEILAIEKKADAEKIIDEWKKKGNLNATLKATLFNVALSKCNVTSLILSREVNLPSPIPMPKVQVSKKK